MKFTFIKDLSAIHVICRKLLRQMISNSIHVLLNRKIIIQNLPFTSQLSRIKNKGYKNYLNKYFLKFNIVKN